MDLPRSESPKSVIMENECLHCSPPPPLIEFNLKSQWFSSSILLTIKVPYCHLLAHMDIDNPATVYICPGGGGGTASLKVGTHCQTTAPTFWHCPPLNLFLPPPIFEGHRPPPPEIKHSLYKIIYKFDPKSSKWLSI